MPIKRTALGRFAHEDANVVINADGRLVAYTRDDSRFEYLYKFVSAGNYDLKDRAANMHLLDDGTLYVGRFNKYGSLNWLSLIHGQGMLTTASDFNSHADVRIRTHQAADRVGAMPMDQPENVEPNRKNGKV
jgi:secreted PhoX family phosphatase